MKDKAEQKLDALKMEISKYDKLIVAFSGGLDSALLLKVSHMVLGNKVLAVISDSPSIPRSELDAAIDFARETGSRLKVVTTGELENESYSKNPDNRCYYCKTELYEYTTSVAREEGIRFIANGTNLDDLGDYRPGLKAAEEHQVVSPLRDAALTKDDIRSIAKYLELNIWDKPASPCLASRIPYGSPVTPEKLAQVEEAEGFVRSLGVKELRVRHFGERAVLEVNPLYNNIVEANIGEIRAIFTKIGFYVTEIKEFKSGSLNKLINSNAKGKTEGAS